MSKYSLKSFVLLWMAVFVLSFLGFIYIILNLFFSEHITRSSLKDLKYTAHVAKLNLSTEQEKMKNALALHVTSPDFLDILESRKFKKIKRLTDNWKEILSISRIQLYNESGDLIEMSTGALSEDKVALSKASLKQLNMGYEETTYTAQSDGLLVSVQRKIMGEGYKNLGYLFEWKKLSYKDLLKNSDSKDLIVNTRGRVVYASKGVEEAYKISEKIFLKGASAFELSLSGKAFEVFRLDIAPEATFFLVKENLKTAVFKSFYKKYLVYFGLYIFILVLLFYMSYRIQVFKPLGQISKFITERKGGEQLQIETSVYEISLIAEKLKEKLSELSDDVERNKKGRVDDMSRLVASVAHELNNSLSYLGGNLEYLKEELGNAGAVDKVEFLEAITSAQSGYERIKKIVSDLRVFSSKRDLDIKWEPLGGLKERVEKEFKNLGLSFPRELFEYEVKVDGDRTFQIIRNLIINAEQAYSTEEADKKILVSFYLEGSSLVISVKDWAGGVPEEVRNKIFEPFFTTKKNKGGAGLGLALSRTLAREMDADLFFKGASSEGTVFCFKMSHFRLKS